MPFSTLLGAKYPRMNWRFENRGVGGNRVSDLLARWEEDCIALKPGVVSILIGINDTWRAFDRNTPRSTEEFEELYRKLLTLTRERATDRIVLMEPFVLPDPPDRAAWRPDLDPKIQAARRLAREFDTQFVPLDGAFARASTLRPCKFWAADGVHPTSEGHALIAQEWMKALGL
ncbi:MAG: SGNH/GDSL hydrolase family protein [Candidatus Sumerlaeota bacterium]|nr:SGNH/GDSL hydrolase family protein [Candidatus Sumerlaeota bacterium]